MTNGWLVCDGKLLAGDVLEVNWWKGNLLPSDGPNYGITLSRFAPGRMGAGYTDDLNEIAEGMVASNQVVLDHHYGLWYDRRREDHERVRRISGDVWPPFMSSLLLAAARARRRDGLSKYDLTKFNPWYWSRLKNFADICDARGLVLFNNHYFQHNILEDGAHWVDCPWRSVNNLNDTGFREPPFEIEKRTVMADQFYDASNPVRRRLHEGLIRRNLDNFTNAANVIQFTSAEFTGPLEFEQFWLDTIAAWESETKFHPLVALAAPKNVQDAILADARRAAVVDIIALRYWWQTGNGLFAPAGGQNLSPRQFQRQWKGGLPSDVNLAAMAAEYRGKFPSKPVIPASEQGGDLRHAGWAFVCAGGSLPNLPASTDSNLLAAIPQMQPWLADETNALWALRQPGLQILVYHDGGTALDLSPESGSFRLYAVNLKNGQVSPGAVIQGGGRVNCPAPKWFGWLNNKSMNKFLLLCGLVAGAMSALAESSVEQWGRFELALNGPSGGNPFVDVKFSVRFESGPSVTEVAGFYDGGGIYPRGSCPGRRANGITAPSVPIPRWMARPACSPSFRPRRKTTARCM